MGLQGCNLLRKFVYFLDIRNDKNCKFKISCSCFTSAQCSLLSTSALWWNTFLGGAWCTIIQKFFKVVNWTPSQVLVIYDQLIMSPFCYLFCIWSLNYHRLSSWPHSSRTLYDLTVDSYTHWSASFNSISCNKYSQVCQSWI